MTQTVVITGAAGHLGRCVSQAFAAQGARLVLVGHSLASLQAAWAGNVGEEHLCLAADLREPAAMQTVVDAAVQRYGRIDVFCHLVGGFCMGTPVHATSDAVWNQMYDTNVRTLLYALRAVVPAMQAAGGGHILTIGAASARQGQAGMGAYIAAKDAVLRLTETLAAELRADHISANCVLPTIIDTPANRAAMPDGDFSAWVQPQDIANTLVWLASAQAKAVQGVGLVAAGRG